MSFGFRNNYQIKERQFFSLLHPPWIVAAKTTDLIQKLFFLRSYCCILLKYLDDSTYISNLKGEKLNLLLR